VTGDLYSSYAELKGWSSDGGSGNPLVFENILAVSGKGGKLRILEIGFGDASFMDWARSVGHDVAGTEIIPECVLAAQKRHHEVYLADAADSLESKRFDLIVAIDVLEHLTLKQFRELMELANKVLQNDGLIVARFPNGDSPFSGRYQAGDFTHEHPLSARSVDQICSPLGFIVTRSVNPRPSRKGLAAKLRITAAYALRDVIETFIGYVYLGYRTPMDPNIIVVLSRK
jgi:2-polyprenyl-3-methyl-5-hydroxy-6-metoxy-1,4-benzoquinol methylase